MLRWVLISLLIIACISSCVSDKEEGTIVSDETLLNLAQNVSSFTYYKNRSDTLIADVESPHIPFVRIRFNPKASSAMNSSMDKLLYSSFPDESMIVKEVYNQKGGPLVSYVIMYKLKNTANNGSGWVWSEISSNGNTEYSALLKGDQCVNCHSANVNSDLVRTFGLH